MIESQQPLSLKVKVFIKINEWQLITIIIIMSKGPGLKPVTILYDPH